ncbi:MAG: hypothetical protein LBP35_05715 [Candidatus Ancillula trichonymphae]|nr:hypothetical protein [Candidatus Ancillula trichonymphae]
MYSHQLFDVLPDEVVVYENCKRLILEGVGIGLVRDLVDKLIFLDVDLQIAYEWYKLRYEKMMERARNDSSSYFAQFLSLSPDEIQKFAREVWINVNERNYFENVLPLKAYADEIWTISNEHVVLNKAMSSTTDEFFRPVYACVELILEVS